MDSSEPPSALLYAAGLIILLLLSMFFSASETAFLSLNKLRLRYLCECKDKRALRAEKILQNQQSFLSTILVGNSIVNIGVSVMLTAFAVSAFGAAGLSLAIAVGTVLVLIFGEILPKSVALAYPDKIALHSAILVQFFMSVLSPFVFVFSFLATLFLRLFNIKDSHTAVQVTEEDLQDFFASGEESGVIAPDERVLFDKILHYADFTARTIMTPRKKIAALSIHADMQEILDLSKESRFSRFPVYETDIDNIIGIFYLKDFLFSDENAALIGFSEAQDFDIKHFLRKPLFVFETTGLVQLQEKFHNEKRNMAVVLDEYGGTAGIVTVEDLNEEIFGSILDEYDADMESEVVKTPSRNSFTVVGSLRLNELNEL
ncbi:hemolysin family protein [Treponema phagedenis]|nr:hemolysin family protein [Treponema phagedenis]